jgi:hypothetical protein
MLVRKLIAGALLVLAFGSFAGCGGGSDESVPAKPFHPRAALRAVGGTVRTDKPEFVSRVFTRPGDANIRSAAIKLPRVVLVDQTALGNICTKRGLEQEDCAGRKRMGASRIVSPEFDTPLAGPVYAVSGYGGLPRLAYLLSGPEDILLHGRIVSKRARIEAGVEEVPDTPIDSFELRIDGGKPGYLVLSRNICKGKPMADATFTSQTGETVSQRVPLEADCGR